MQSSDGVGRQVKGIRLPWSSWRGETLRGDEVKQTESRDGRERQPRRTSRTSNSASLCSCAGTFPLQTLMYNHMLNPLIRWPQDSQLRNNWWVVGIGVVGLMTFMVLSNTKSLSYCDHWSNYLLFREPSWADLVQCQDGHMGSGLPTNYSHKCVFFLHNSSQSEAAFVFPSRHLSFRSFLKMAVYHLEGHVPKMNSVGRKGAIQKQTTLGQDRSACVNWLLQTRYAHLRLEEMLVSVMVRVGQPQEEHV